jgi:hypothetical protein
MAAADAAPTDDAAPADAADAGAAGDADGERLVVRGAFALKSELLR